MVVDLRAGHVEVTRGQSLGNQPQQLVVLGSIQKVEHRARL